MGWTYVTVQVSAAKKKPNSALAAQLWGILPLGDLWGFSLAEMHSNPPRTDQLAGPAASSTLCHAEQPKHAETQLLG